MLVVELLYVVVIMVDLTRSGKVAISCIICRRASLFQHHAPSAGDAFLSFKAMTIQRSRPDIKRRYYADMARRGRSGSGHASNEFFRNAELPQSTLAAQLVSHFTDGKKHPRTQNDETFRQLLQEILDAESGQVVRPEPLETDSDVDCKLIYVIVKAGLEKISSDDPFNGKTEMSRQAADSLTAINFTIKRNPEILFAAPQFQGPDPRPIGPLYLWLVPKLLSIAGCVQDSGTIDRVLRVFTTSLVTERKTHVKSVTLHPILKYVKGCING